jgi:hypothetical protein
MRWGRRKTKELVKEEFNWNQILGAKDELNVQSAYLRMCPRSWIHDNQNRVLLAAGSICVFVGHKENLNSCNLLFSLVSNTAHGPYAALSYSGNLHYSSLTPN